MSMSKWSSTSQFIKGKSRDFLFHKIFEQNSSMFKIGTGGCGVCGGCGGWYPSGFGGGCTGHGGCSGVFPVTFVLY